MTEAECEQTYDQLVVAINNVGLLWLTNQIAEEIRFGRATTIEVTERADTPDDLLFPNLTKRPRHSQVTVSATRIFTSQEKLMVLLDALEQAVIATYEMETAVKEYVSETSKNWKSIRLVRTDEPTSEPIEITLYNDEERNENINTLRRLMKGLRGLI